MLIVDSDAIRGLLVKFLAGNLLKIDPSSSLLTQFEPQLWVEAFEYKTANFAPKEQFSRHLSNLIATICTNNQEDLDRATFTKLIETSKISCVNPTIAVALCDIEDRLQQELNEENLKESKFGKLSTLQEKCAAALAGTWQELRKPDAETLEKLKNRKPEFLVDLLSKSLNEKARSEVKIVSRAARRRDQFESFF